MLTLAEMRTLTLFLVLIVAVVSAVSGYVIARHRHPDDDVAAYIRHRPVILHEAARAAPRGGVLLIGDSIAERSGVTSLCGERVLNAGVSSARMADIAAMAPDLAAILHPGRVIIQIGTNDAARTVTTDHAGWSRRYIALVRSLGRVPVLLAPAPEIEPGKSRSGDVDASRLTALNAELPAIARATGASLADRPRVSTLDGAHLDGAGALAWQALLEARCHNA